MFRRIPFIGGGGYSGKVLGTAAANLIGYWPMWETSGAVADNLEGTAARDGAYTGVTLGSSTGPDGRPVGLWDGANDFCDIYTASLNTAFNTASGTVAIWFKVSAAGVWTDAALRYFINIRADADNRIYIIKSGTDNLATFVYEAGNTPEVITSASFAGSTAWHHMALTWNKAGDAVKAYIDGVQSGGTETGLGIWAGALNVGYCNIGSYRNIAQDVFDGYLAHAAIWNTPLTPTQILALATV